MFYYLDVSLWNRGIFPLVGSSLKKTLSQVIILKIFNVQKKSPDHLLEFSNKIKVKLISVNMHLSAPVFFEK